jgi:hypothetical protein
MMDEAALVDHFGEQASAWASARRAIDPAGILDSPLTYTGTEQSAL